MSRFGMDLTKTQADGAIAIIEASRLRRDCLRLALAQHTPERPVTEAGTAAELLTLVRSGNAYALVLVGAALAEQVDARELDTLAHALPGTPVVVVAEGDNPQHSRRILAAGARCFLPASLSLRGLLGAIDLVLAGGEHVPAAFLDPRPSAPAPTPWPSLTRRQRDVLSLIAQGRSNKLIAEALAMSESTVKAHVKQIIKRLNVANRTQAALVATGNGAFAPVLRRAPAEAA
jgi:DNA-binding NarL/FixJ family response regulator